MQFLLEAWLEKTFLMGKYSSGVFNFPILYNNVFKNKQEPELSTSAEGGGRKME